MSNSHQLPSRKIGSLNICPIINGLWQISNGSLGDKTVTNNEFVKYMFEYSLNGLNTFDGADHYGPSEFIMGLHKKRNISNNNSNKCYYFTKYVPEMNHPVSYEITLNAINRSLIRMKTSSLDLLQFHWWNYNDYKYIKILKYLLKLKLNGKIKEIGLTNFNTFHLKNIIKNIPNINIVSNQLPYSLIDNRIENNMIPFCLKNNIKILTYGTLLGGFLSNKYLGINCEPTKKSDLNTVSLKRYYKFIMSWSNNSWLLFQELLTVLNEIGIKHNNSTIAQISVKYILDKPCVAGVIIGCRLSVSNHIKETKNIFNINLTKNDKNRIETVLKKGRKLYGEPADEHRGSKL